MWSPAPSSVCRDTTRNPLTVWVGQVKMVKWYYRYLTSSFVILSQLAKVDWAGLANGVLTNLPGIIQASANAGKVRKMLVLKYVTHI